MLPAQGGAQSPNVFQQSAGAYNGAVNATNGALAMNATAPAMMAQTAQAQTSTYNPFTGLNADGSAMAGFGAGSASGGGYTADQAAAARDVTAGQFGGMDISPYLNPYTSQVVDQTAADMERARLIEQNQADDAMQAAGAFGGSRHGIANAETNRNFYDRLGATTGALRNQGYQNAQQAAFQDIANRMNADLANQQSDLSTNQFNANAVNQARMTGANNATSASIANANAQTQLAGQRLGAVNDAARFGAQAMNDTSRFNAGNMTDTSRFNSTAYNDAAQRRFNNQMGGASQLGGLATLGFNMGNSISDRQARDGALARGVQQDIMNAAMQQWAGYTGAGNLGLGNLQSGVASAPSGAGSTTQTQNPGLLGILGAIAGI